MSDFSALIEPVLGIGRRASERILEVYRTDFGVEAKDDRSPLTAADMASHETICAGLRELTPELPVLSEESSSVPAVRRRSWVRYWLVDPLDGTREFVKRNGEFTVNIALIDEQRPVLGVVAVPAQDLVYSAARGYGAWRQAADGSRERIRTRRTDAGHVAAAGSRSHGSEQQQRFFAALGPQTEIIAIGSALKFCLVAEGRADIYPRFGPTSEWDTAAAQCVVEEAGGVVTDMQLRPLRYNTRDTLLNPHFLVIGDRDFDWVPYLDAAG
jgi:3'(2'), 5'-bisphosphate nucleotidase